MHRHPIARAIIALLGITWSAATLGIGVNANGSWNKTESGWYTDQGFQTDGEDGSNRATVSGGSPDGGAAFYASGTLLGDLALPLLAAWATAEYWDDTAYEAAAQVEVLQTYRYTGTDSGQYTIEFAVDGFNQGAMLTAQVLLFIGDRFITGRSLNAGSDGPILLIDAFSFWAQPLDVLLIRILLRAWADARTAGQSVSVDAANTMTVYFTAGDTSLLTPEVAPVPLPPAALALVTGLLALGRFARHRRR